MHQVVEQLAVSWPPEAWADVTILVAVSGGADSVALLRALCQLRRPGEGRIVVAHYNHKLRPTSDRDERSVQALAEQLGLALQVGGSQVGLEAFDRGDGLEDSARRARYDFLARTAGETGARYVATAHTADDQAETVLHRILRGTGISGLGGIPRARPLGAATLLRPLLEVRRAELRGYLAELGQPFAEDPTNRDPAHTRNRIRHELIPHLEEYNPDVVGALVRLGRLSSEAQGTIEALVEQEQQRAVRREGSLVVLDRSHVRRLCSYLKRELLVAVWRGEDWPRQAMGFVDWQKLVELLDRGEGKRMFPGGVVAEATQTALTLRREGPVS